MSSHEKKNKNSRPLFVDKNINANIKSIIHILPIHSSLCIQYSSAATEALLLDAQPRDRERERERVNERWARITR